MIILAIGLVCYLIDSCCIHSLKNIIKSSILVIEYVT